MLCGEFHRDRCYPQGHRYEDEQEDCDLIASVRASLLSWRSPQGNRT